jgi:V8-like Glu-specific endopeptidase
MSIEVFNRTKIPYTAVVAIDVTFPDGYTARGTGAIVGVNDVLTATHVIYNPDHGGWATSMNVFPGADYNSAQGYYQDQPYKLGAYTWRSTGWITQTFSDQDNIHLSFAESQYDVAIVGFDVRIGDQTGWFGMASGYDSPQWAYALGYPRDSTGMMLAQTWVTKENGYGVYSSYANNGGDLMGPGSSGGPLYVMVGGDSYLIGVKSSGTDGISNHWADIGFLYDQIRSAITANDSLLSGAVADDYSSSVATSGNLSIGGSMIGNIEVGGDIDWFRVSLIAGFTYRIDLAGETAGGGSISDPILRLLNSSGVQVAYNDDIFAGVNRNSRIEFTAVSTGPFYVEASGFLSVTGTYRISAVAADTTPPTISYFSPSDGLTGVVATANVVVTFSEAIQRGAGRIGLWNASNGGAYVEHFDVASSTRISVSGSTLTIDPTNALTGNTQYFVTFDSGNITDLAGNAYAGTYQYDFTVAASNRPPVVTARMFDQNWIEGASLHYTVPTGTITDPDGNALSFSASLSTGSPLPSWLNFNTATLDFTGTAPKGSPDYTVRVTGTDTGGLSTYDDVVFFTVAAAVTDTTPPTVYGFRPADVPAGLPIDRDISFIFSEPIQRGTGSITLKTAAGLVVATYDAANSSNLSTFFNVELIINPTDNLSYGTLYLVEFTPGSIKDFAGNNFLSNTSYSFKTVAAPAGQTYTGTDFNDRFTSGPGNDAIDGAAGIDTVVLNGTRSEHTLAKTFIGWTISSPASGTDKIVNVERLEFAGKKLALDLQPSEPAGQALEFIGLLAPTLVRSPSVVGTILGLFDQGKSLYDVCQLALDVGLVNSIAGSDTNAALAAMAFRNLIGSEADAATVDMLVGYMDGRSASYSQADFMTVIAGMEVNQTHIGLIGLQQTGIEYV